METCCLFTLFSECMLYGSCRLHGITKDDATRFILGCIGSELFHQHLERLDLVKVCKLDELVL